MAFFGSQEILLIFMSLILLAVPIVLIVAVIYGFTRGKREKEAERIQRLEARITELEKEKAREEKLNQIEKQYKEQYKL